MGSCFNILDGSERRAHHHKRGFNGTWGLDSTASGYFLESGHYNLLRALVLYGVENVRFGIKVKLNWSVLADESLHPALPIGHHLVKPTSSLI